MKKLLILLLIAHIFHCSAIAGDAAQAWLDFDSGKQNLPDYSYAGYEYFSKPLPQFTNDNSRVFRAEDFGAVPDDNRSDYDAITRAIRSAEKYARENPGKYGIVAFKAGRFNVREPEDIAKGALTVRGDRVVLSGSGMYDDGTELWAAAAAEAPVILFEPPAVKMYNWRGDLLAQIEPVNQPENYGAFTPVWKVKVREQFVPKLAACKPGDIVRVCGSWEKREAEYFHPLKPYGKKRFYVVEYHEIQSVNGSEITFREPIWAKRSDLSDLYVTPVIREGGIENMTLSGNFREKMRHYWSSQSDGYSMVATAHMRNGLFRQLRFRHATCAINIGGSANTVMDAMFEQHWGHLMVRAGGGSYGNFFGLIREYAQSWHGIGSTDFSPNTTVWRSAQLGNVESHGNSNYNLLVDLNSGDFRRFRWGGVQPFCHRGLTYWNWRQIPLAGAGNNNLDFSNCVLPAVVGLHGDAANLAVPDASARLSIFESMGKKVQPESLFEAQLAKRLGKVPEWLASSAAEFEKYRRHASGALVAPLPLSRFASGQKIPVEFQPDARFKNEHVEKVEFIVSRQAAIERGPEKVFATVAQYPFKAELALPEDGNYVIRARMTTVRKDQFNTPDCMIQSGTPPAKPAVIKDAFWLQDYNGAAPFEKLWEQEKNNRAAFAEDSRKLIDSLNLRAKAKLWLDGNPATKVYEYARHVCHLELQEASELLQGELLMTFDPRASAVEYELAVSNDPACFGDVRNRLDGWKTIARHGFTLVEAARFKKGGYYTFPIYLSKEHAKFVRIIVGGGTNNIHEIRLFNANPKEMSK